MGSAEAISRLILGTTKRYVVLISVILASIDTIFDTGGVSNSPVQHETTGNDQDLQDRVNQGQNQQPILYLDTHDGHPGNGDRRGSFYCIRYMFRR